MQRNTLNYTISRRRWLQMAASVAGMALLSNVLSACGASASGSAGARSVTKLALGCDGDTLAFDHTTLTAPAGATIELTFDNRSNHHQHNWVLVNGGNTEAAAVYAAAIAAGAKQEWLPPTSALIITHTPLVESGKHATITFQAPAQPGDYTYLCTFPGHFLAGMKGTFNVA
jgi:azurin